MKRILSLILAMTMVLSVAACGGDSGDGGSGGNGTTAATMHLTHTEGTVSVSDGGGKDVPVLDNLGLYSGYGVDTRSASYAWIGLDDAKLVKMDQNSGIAIQKEGRTLDIEVKSGRLFFNVTRPLEDDETMNIRASTMIVGIRGTCGWVEERDGLARVYVLEGKVNCSVGGRMVRVNAGEMGSLTANGELVVEPFGEPDLPAFVRDDLVRDPGLCGDIYEASGLDILGIPGAPGTSAAPETSETPAVTEPPTVTDAPAISDPPAATETPQPSAAPETSDAPQPTAVPEASGRAGDNVTWSYSSGVLTISGTGPMYDYYVETGDDDWYEFMEQPWRAYYREINTIVIENGVTTIGGNAFGSNGGDDYQECAVTNVIIPDGVTSIGAYAFFECINLSGVVIPDGVTSIGEAAFSFCGRLTSVTIPDSVTSIGGMAFGYSSLRSVNIPDGVTTIEGSTFCRCPLTEVTIPDGVTSIGGMAFAWCGSLTSVTIPASVTSVGYAAFFGCGDLTVYYAGSESQWAQISIDEGDVYENGALVNANIHFNSTGN